MGVSIPGLLLAGLKLAVAMTLHRGLGSHQSALSMAIDITKFS